MARKYVTLPRVANAPWKDMKEDVIISFSVIRASLPEKVMIEQRPGGSAGATEGLPEGRALQAEGKASATGLRENPPGVFLDIRESCEASKALITRLGTQRPLKGVWCCCLCFSHGL